MADLVDHLGELAGAGRPHQADHARIGVDDRPGLVEIVLVAADHDGQHAVLGAGLAAGDRRVEEARSRAPPAFSASSRATSAEAVVLSMKTAPFFIALKAPSWPIVTVAQIVVIADAGEDEILARRPPPRASSATPPPCSPTHFSALAPWCGYRP